MFPFGDSAEIKSLREKWPEMSYEEKLDTFLWKMVWFHHEKHIPGNPNQAIEGLTKVIESANKSSENLTTSIRTATWVGGIAAAVAAIVAIVALWLSIVMPPSHTNPSSIASSSVPN